MRKMAPMGPWPWALGLALALALAPRRPEADLLGVRGRSPRFREAEGRLIPHFGKPIFKKSAKKSGMSTFGVKTKVVRTEILHISV